MSKKELWIKVMVDAKDADKKISEMKKKADAEIQKTTGKATASSKSQNNAGDVSSPLQKSMMGGILQAQLLSQGVAMAGKGYGAMLDYNRGATFKFEAQDAKRDLAFQGAGALVGAFNPALGSIVSQLGAFADTAEYRNFKDVTTKTASVLEQMDSKARGMGKIFNQKELSELATYVAGFENQQLGRRAKIKQTAETATKDLLGESASMSGIAQLEQTIIDEFTNIKEFLTSDFGEFVIRQMVFAMKSVFI